MVKLIIDFITWRWAPAVGLLTASMLYVGIVVGLVPSEIGVPVANAKFETKPPNATGGLFGGTPANGETNESRYAPPRPPGETRPVSTPPRPIVRAPVADFGRRGFSPPIQRPEPPAPPAVAPAPPSPVAPLPRAGFAGIFSRIQGALRPGSTAAQSLSEAAQARMAQAASAQPAPAAAPSAEQPAPPAPAAPAPADAAQQQPPDAQQPPPAPDNGAPPPAAPSAEPPAQ
ncbi:MAG TPA: hypothetical protein VMI54_28400 [Polyangiaceae bacterium]|nr:hypothetical protein [Polyangiaceae bacterium]